MISEGIHPAILSYAMALVLKIAHAQLLLMREAMQEVYLLPALRIQMRKTVPVTSNT